MLILSRKLNETICIGDNIEIMITQIEHDRVKLGIIAPKDVPVDRLEVRNKKVRTNNGDNTNNPSDNLSSS